MENMFSTYCMWVAVIFLVIMFLGWVWGRFLNYETESGYKKIHVTNKYFTPSSSSFPMGMGPSGPVVSYSSTEEEYTIEFVGMNKNKVRLKVSQYTYDQIDIGDKLKAFYKIKNLTGFKYTGNFEKVGESLKNSKKSRLASA